MRNFSYFVNKAIFDPKFVQAVQEDPEQALKEIGIEPTKEILQQLEEIDLAQIQKLAQAFDGPMTAMP